MNTKIILLLVLLTNIRFSGAQHLWTEVNMNKSAVYIGEPVEVSISVYTSTWFTEGVDIGNIKVNGAYSMYFRSVSASKNINGKTYSGVQLIYNIFPYTDKNVLFPALDFEVTTPDEGESQGVKRKIKTKSKTIHIKPVPPGIEKEHWLVASGTKVSQTWSKNITNLKLGDVVKRQISLNVNGTVGELIPPLKWDSIQGVSLYPGRSSVANTKTKTSIGASRKETMQYLFETEGQIQIPEIVFNWYDPQKKQLFKYTLPGVKININPNPAMDMLTSIKDSLLHSIETTTANVEKKPLTILGLPMETFAIVLLLCLLCLYFLYRIIKYWTGIYRKKKEIYRNSEAWYFKQFLLSAKNNDKGEILSSLYRWIDELKYGESDIQSFAFLMKADYLIHDIKSLLQPEKKTIINTKDWKRVRQEYINRNKENSNMENWINP